MTTGHDMSRYWRLVSNDGGFITGTWWVTRPDEKRGGEQQVRPIDVTMWNEGRHFGVVLEQGAFAAFVKGGEVEPLHVRGRDHIVAEVRERHDEIVAVVLAVAAAVEWPELEADQ